MQMVNLNAFHNWQQAKPRRSVNIELGTASDNFAVKVWVYDYGLGEGMHVSSVADIDLEGKVRELELKKLEELKAKYES